MDKDSNDGNNNYNDNLDGNNNAPPAMVNATGNIINNTIATNNNMNNNNSNTTSTITLSDAALVSLDVGQLSETDIINIVNNINILILL